MRLTCKEISGRKSCRGIRSHTGTVVAGGNIHALIRPNWGKLCIEFLIQKLQMLTQMQINSSMSLQPGNLLAHNISSRSPTIEGHRTNCGLQRNRSLGKHHRSVAAPCRARCCTGIGLLMYKSAAFIVLEARTILSASCCSYCSDRYCRSSIWLYEYVSQNIEASCSP